MGNTRTRSLCGEIKLIEKMKKAGKYYTPTIEEFHVGFEYEAYEAGSGNEYNKEEFGNDDLLDIKKVYSKGLELGWLRVKHLDREDIEEFHKKHFEEIPFKYDNNAEPTPGRTPYECPTAYLMDDQLHSGELWILYHYSDGMVWIDYVKDCSSDGYLFRGFVKNKSELKRILTQIGAI